MLSELIGSLKIYKGKITLLNGQQSYLVGLFY